MTEQFRISLAGSINTRIVTPAALSLTTSVVGVAVVGIAVVGDAGVSTTKDQRFINCFTESVTNPYTGKKTLVLVKRPGFAASGLTPQAGSIGNDILVWTGASNKIISAFGATNSSIYDSASQLVTNAVDTTKITGKARSITETKISDVATLTIASTDSTAWYYQPAGTVTKISDVDFPGNAGFTTVGGFAHIDGYACIATTDGKLWNSDVNSVVNWTSTSFLSANSYPDAGIAVIRKGDKLMYFGTESIQFFSNPGNTSGSPFSRVEPLTLKIGALSADAIVDVKGAVFWAGSSPQGGIAIYSYGDGPKRVSTPELESIFLLAGTSNISLTATTWFGRNFVLVQASTITFAYCIEDPGWFEVSSQTPLWYKATGVSAGTQVTYAISKNSTGGKIYVINPAAYTFRDDGVVYTTTMQTSLIGDGNRKTYWEEIEVLADRETSTSNLWVAASDDDYLTSSYMGVIDLSSARGKLTRLGSAYRRSWILTHQSNTPFRIEALIGRKTVGA